MRFTIMFLSLFIPTALVLGAGIWLAFAGGGVWLLWVGVGVQCLMPVWAPPVLSKVDSWL